MRYRAWADRLLFQSLAKLPEASLSAAQPIVFGNLLRTLNHTYCMDQVWKAHLQGVPHGFTTRNPEDCPVFEVLRSAQADIDDWYVRHAEMLDERACGEAIRFTYIGGGEGEMRRGDILLHVVNHATYHRGHVAMMMYGLSVPPPTTDLPVFLRDADSG
ncbi:DNA damage-inducible protein DinB [Dyella flagellata]|uniref:DNA damage-inducible protein DinB n=2 Tax=Dyella flagellata TaxID=1867833 RepID=A0ABQ5XER7_9GAMM|nr:DNA damage-inducible protein DinB [Dyella flagellata]